MGSGSVRMPKGLPSDLFDSSLLEVFIGAANFPRRGAVSLVQVAVPGQ